jgi:hypothetical protein
LAYSPEPAWQENLVELTAAVLYDRHISPKQERLIVSTAQKYHEGFRFPCNVAAEFGPMDHRKYRTSKRQLIQQQLEKARLNRAVSEVAVADRVEKIS